MAETNSQREAPGKSASGKKAQLREKRAQQLTISRSALKQLAKPLKTQQENLRLCEELLDHSDSFYVEVNKLTRGRTPLPATPLVRQTLNDIISDAKRLIKIKEDVHMDRIKEFVPAGDEPSYSDVLVITGSVRHCLQRHREKQIVRLKTLRAKLVIVETVIGALEYFLNDEDASWEEKEYPSKAAVRLYVDGSISDPCFTQYSNSSEYYFDYEKLDSMSFQDYMSMLAYDGDNSEEEDSLFEDSDSSNDEDTEGDQEGKDEG